VYSWAYGRILQRDGGESVDRSSRSNGERAHCRVSWCCCTAAHDGGEETDGGLAVGEQVSGRPVQSLMKVLYDY
jgi:hypothetical protein